MTMTAERPQRGRPSPDEDESAARLLRDHPSDRVRNSIAETMGLKGSPQRGRPRPIETIRRDETILQLLKDHPGGLERNAIAELMNLDKVKTYLSLDRLRKQGLADKSKPESQADKDTLWVAISGES